MFHFYIQQTHRKHFTLYNAKHRSIKTCVSFRVVQRDMHPITGIISRQILQCLMRLFCWHYQCCCFKFWNSGSITDLRVDCLLTCLKIECELMSLFPWIAHLLFCVHSAFRSASYYIQLLVDIKVLIVCLSEKNSSG